MLELIFPYTFVPASGLLPAQFSYTGAMIRTVDSYYSIPNCMNATAHMDHGQRHKNFSSGLSPKKPLLLLPTISNLACNP